MSKETRVFTIMYSTHGKIGETISQTVTDYEKDCTDNENFLFELYNPDVGVFYKHEVIEVPTVEIPPLKELDIPEFPEVFGKCSLEETEHRDALISYLVMGVRATNLEDDMITIVNKIVTDVYDNYDELTALNELERRLT